ncbi:MAG: tyrosine--tRNA ligase [Firmicutes bacterium]|jgi:tyrosyl-tRNA synthetase|nr:tyrosine--tRNA ligase [Bacillota bacterium]
MNCFEDLEYRGLIKDISSPELKNKLNNEKLTFYIGTDPTADSMHIGHFSSFLIATRLAKYGHKPILLVGGATGLIGDPKPSVERQMITREQVQHNVEGLTKQAKEIFGFEVVNNYDWIKDINTIDFLRDYGKYINVNYMLDKDIIARRLESGITFCEFAYTILQGLDFLHLYHEKGCTLEVAGSDQWGNITTGIELARKKDDVELFGLTMPLVLDANGVKFGKTEGNALWLDKNKTSSYELFQYLINSDDNCVIDYLKKLTFLTKEEIEDIEAKHKEQPELRLAQKTLAKEVITFLHGEEEYNKALRISEALFSGNIKELSLDEIEDGFKDVPNFELSEELSLIDLLVNNNIASSRREAREFISAGSISINGDKYMDENEVITRDKAIENKVLVIRRGKKKYFMGLFK